MRKATLALALIMFGMAPQPEVEQAPDFVLQNLEGDEVRLSSYKDQVVLLNFWATWCPPCLAEIPSLISLYEKYQSSGFEVIGVALDEESVAGLRSFVRRYGVSYPVLIGDDKVVKAFGGIRGIPTTFLMDRQHRIVRRFVGEQRKSTFEQAIVEALGG